MGAQREKAGVGGSIGQLQREAGPGISSPSFPRSDVDTDDGGSISMFMLSPESTPAVIIILDITSCHGLFNY